MMNLKNELTKRQLSKFMKGMQGGKGIIFKPTQKQINGGFLGTLAAIGNSMAIELASKLFRKGLQVIKKKPRRARKRITCRPKTKKFISLLSTSFF